LTVKGVILDTNAVLRFITGDSIEKCQKVSDLLDKSDCIVPIEVLAEAVYNLEKFYKHPRQLIAAEIRDFIDINWGILPLIKVKNSAPLNFISVCFGALLPLPAC